MSHTENIRITDLARPELSPKAREFIAATRDIAVEFTVDAVRQAAAAQLNGIALHDDPGLHERLGVLCAAMDEDADLSPMGRLSLFGMLVRYLVQRCRLEQLYREHPEIEEVEIRAPLVITGLPRSGTTHLLNLISTDPRLRSLQYWESLEPIPRADEPATAGVEDPRIQRCRDELAMRNEILPLFDAMHDMHPFHIHEEIELLAMDFSTALFDTMAQLPRWTDYYLAHDQTPHYEFLGRCLKALQWLRGPERWVLKSPQHLEQLAPLMNAFPDARVVVTHRDPVSVMASMMTMVAYAARMSRDPVRPAVIGETIRERMVLRLRALVETRHLLPPQQSVDVLFHEFMADDVATVERIYAMAGHPMTPAVRDAMKRYMGEHSRGKHGQVVYDMKADFGIDPAAVREQLGFYYRAFPVKVGA